MGCLTYISVIVVILSISIFVVPQVLDRNVDSLKGLIPLSHRGIPWGFSADRIPDQAGKTILVTGANVGLGYWSSYHLAAKSANVIMACRNMKKGEAAKAKILESLPNANVEVLHLDLSDLNSVRQFSESFLNTHGRLDSLILNAGVMDPPYTLSKQNLELQFAVNHLGHFYLTKLLLPMMEILEAATIVSVSSAAHYATNEVWTDLETLNNPTWYKVYLRHYANSKLANIFFAQELHTQLRERGLDNIFVNSVHPGVVLTDLTRQYGLPQFMGAIAEWLTENDLWVWKARDAALTQVFAAVSPEILDGKISGKYYHPIARKTTPNPATKNLENQQKLWSWSEELILSFEEGKL